MSRDASITRDWGDGTYTFRLAWGELLKLQEACDAGPWFILFQMHGMAQATVNPGAVRHLRIEMIREVVRWGLIGGGIKPDQASRLIKLYVEGRPPDESLLIAIEVLRAGLEGAPDELPGEADAADQRAQA